MRKKNASTIAIELRDAIQNGTYQRFERLPASRQLAEEFGVARNTLREALHRLEAEGIVETRLGSGTYVIPPQSPIPAEAKQASPLELIDTRFALEPHICRLCVLHGRHDDFNEMERLCDAMEAAQTDPIRFSEADTHFHFKLATTTRNNLIIWLITQIDLVRSLDEWTRMRQLTLNKNVINSYNQQHRDILHALRNREPETAATNMKRHLEFARLSLTRLSDT